MGRYVLFPPAGSLHHYCFYADHYNITASPVRGFVAAAAAGEREPALTHAAQIRKAPHWPHPSTSADSRACFVSIALAQTERRPHVQASLADSLGRPTACAAVANLLRRTLGRSRWTSAATMPSAPVRTAAAVSLARSSAQTTSNVAVASAATVTASNTTNGNTATHRYRR